MSKMTKNKLALLALAGLATVASGSATAAMTVDSKGGIEIFEIDNNDYWFKFSGRMMFDQVFFDNDNDDNNFSSSVPSGAHIRSTRLTFKGGVGHNWVYKLDVDVIDNPGDIDVGINEAFVGYVCNNLWFAVGQVSIPFGLENWSSTAELTFMEPSLPSQAFSPIGGIGLYGEWHSDVFTVEAAIYHPNPAGSFQTGDDIANPALFPGPGGTTGAPIAGTGPNDSTPGSDDIGYAARITFSPVHNKHTVYHAGVSARWEGFHEHANNFNYTTRLEAFNRQTPIIFSNIPPNTVDDHTVWGFELAGRWGPVLLQGEYMVADVDRDDNITLVFPDGIVRNAGGDLDYYGYYIAASYVLTGEAREYDFDNGTFGSVRPCSRKGAWEIGIRHSYVNLLDNTDYANTPFFRNIDFVANGAADSSGQLVPNAGNKIPTGIGVNSQVGGVHSTVIGLNWYVNKNVRFTANYVRTDMPESDDVDALGLRAQVVW